MHATVTVEYVQRLSTSVHGSLVHKTITLGIASVAALYKPYVSVNNQTFS